MADAQMPGYVHFFAGAAGGALGTILTSPLEVVKTRLQSSQGSVFAAARTAPWYARSKTWLCFSESIQKEGIRVLWRGLGPNLVGVVPARSIYFFTYSFAKARLVNLTTSKQENPFIHVLAAISAGLATTTATNPLWLIKTRLQLVRSGHGENVSTLGVIRQIYAQDGLRGFYRGLSASYVGISETTLQFLMYEQLKAKFNDTNTFPESSRYFLAAGFAKFLACTICYPHEVVRTRMREVGSAKYNTIMSTLKTVVREEGIRGLYSGMPAHMLRVVPNSAIMFFTYEFVVDFYKRHNDLPAKAKV